MNWLLRVMDRPAFLSNLVRFMKLSDDRRDERSGLPSRLQGKWRIPVPFLPEWAGGGLWVDPLGKLFPITEFMRPLERVFQQDTRVNRAAEYAITDWHRAGQISKEDATAALTTRTGAVWDRAFRQAQSQEGGDWMDYMSMFISPAMYLQYPWRMLTGETEKLQPLPMSRGLQALSTVTGLEGLRSLDVEARIRQGMGLNEFGEWGDYYLDRQMSNIATENPDKVNEIIRNMIDRSGPWYDEALNRVRFEMAMRHPMSSPVYAAKEGAGLGNVLGSMLFGWLPGHMLPQGELEQRGLKEVYNAAWDEYHNGNTDAIDEFFEANPEYKARLALFDEPQERMRQFLISEVWDSYYKMPQLHRKEVREQLGPVFNEQFLSSDTRDYESLDPQTLAYWAKLMGGQIPESVDAPQGSLAFSKDSIAQAYEKYYKEREQLFPGINQVQEIYYNTPEERQEQLKASSNIEMYWDWKNQQLAKNPDLIPYLTSEESRLFGAPQEVAELVYQYRAERAKLFPDVYDLQNDYYDIPGDNWKERKQFKEMYPQLEDYWKWQRNVFARFPEILPYVRSVESIARDVLGDDYQDKYGVGPTIDISKFPLALSRQLQGYYYGEKLTPGAMEYLIGIWEQEGGEQDFKSFLDSLQVYFVQ
jgi:hypothetical protein